MLLLSDGLLYIRHLTLSACWIVARHSNLITVIVINCESMHFY